jgi:CTP synthase
MIGPLEQAGLIFSGRHPEQPIMQVLELPRSAHPYFIGAQFHPELTSRPLSPQPMFMGLVAAGILKADPDRCSDTRLMEWVYKGSAGQSEPGGGSGDSDPGRHVPSPCTS